MSSNIGPAGRDRSSGATSGELRVVKVVAGPMEPEADQLLDLSGVLVLLRRHWLLLLALTLCGGMTGYGVSYLVTPKYRVETLLTLVSDEQSGGGGLKGLAGQFGGLASMAGIDLGGATDHSRSATIAMLKSHRFIEQLISDQQLLPYIARRIRDPAKLQSDPPTLQECADVFIKKALTVNEDRKTGLVTLRIEWFDRERIAGWANTLVAKANAVNRERAIQNANDSINYLDKELAHADTVEVRQSMYGLLESQMNKRMVAITRPEFSFRVIDPAQTPRIRDRVGPIRPGFAAVGAMLLLAIGSVVVLLRSSPKAAADER